MSPQRRRSASRTSFDLLEAPGHLIRRAQQVHSSVWSELVGSELTSVQFAVLVVLDASPGLDQRMLGQRVSLDPSSLADVCRRLVDRRLIARERDRADARRNRLRLTDEGRRVVEEVTPLVEQVSDRLFDRFSSQEGAELMRLLKHLVETGERPA